MKLRKKELKTCRCAYLYADGHMVLAHEKRDRDAGTVEWVTIYENLGVLPRFQEGRLIIKPEVLPFLLEASHVNAGRSSVKNGSQRTKEAGISVQTIELQAKKGGEGRHWSWHINQFPDLIVPDIEYQENVSESFEDVEGQYRWSGYSIKHVYRQ